MNRKRIWSILAVVIMLAGLLAVAGCAGDDGAVGPAGLRGLQGEQGAPGDAGSRGATGSQGEQGIPGTDGSQGAVGEQGVQGPAGADGTDGDTGEAGPRGFSGSGSRGSTGATGAIGAPGSQGPAGVFPAFSVQLQVKNSGLATITYDTVIFASGARSLHLTTAGVIGNGEEARIALIPIQPMTLGEVLTISWSEYLVSGYMPHVDIRLDTDGDGIIDDALVIEYAYNTSEGAVRPEGQPTYGGLTAAWYQTFSDDGNGPAVIGDSSLAWLASGAPGPAGGVFGDGNFWLTTLGAWKTGLGSPSAYVDANTLVTAIEIEIDNWIIGGGQSEAYVDNITINGVAIPD